MWRVKTAEVFQMLPLLAIFAFNIKGKKVHIKYTFTFLTPAPKTGVIVIACAVRAAAVSSAAVGINLVGVPQTKPMQ